MDEDQAFSILEGAAGLGTEYPPGTFSGPDLSMPQPNETPSSANYPPVTVPPTQGQPPLQPPSGGSGMPSFPSYGDQLGVPAWTVSLIDAACGAFVGYVAAPTARDRALYAAAGGLGGWFLGSLGIGAVGFYAVRHR